MVLTDDVSEGTVPGVPEVPFVGIGVKTGGEEDGGRVMLGRIGSVVVRLFDREARIHVVQ